jgi:hypothetical protein
VPEELLSESLDSDESDSESVASVRLSESSELDSSNLNNQKRNYGKLYEKNIFEDPGLSCWFLTQKLILEGQAN